MNKIKTLLFAISIAGFAWSCEQETKSVEVSDNTTESTSNLPAPTEDKDLGQVKQGLAVGAIKEACQLVSEDWLRAKIPGFQVAEDVDIKRLSRTSPDGNASACQCTVGGEKRAFVIGYKKAAGNLQYINSLLTEGMKKDDDLNIPPYQEVRELGQRAAFSQHNGNLAWVTEDGLYLYMYMYPQSPATMKSHFNVLYSLAPEINQVVKQYGAK
ncbi:MAG: hypothetical protein AAGG68_21580 [Bacteroidota bacterium]